ncbi:hypothetical protein BN8_02540 [Fibrisoma limi BUZ 3]|uniref:Uncharacterized protein n=1 Tax=Fibrisoma limi BUZ 3 TaxID=1185876 RepID=I2GHS0_9BACT|nr:hypothetical protein BN8_02540 [Fibrisoma limi BUZ 3]
MPFQIRQTQPQKHLQGLQFFTNFLQKTGLFTQIIGYF